MKHILKFLTCSLIVFLASCDASKDIEPEGTAVQAMAGDWFVLQDNITEEVYGTTYKRIVTYNTASNYNDTLYVNTRSVLTSNSNFIMRAGVNIKDLTFNTQAGVSTTGATVNIIEGKILSKAATTIGGNKSDSIFIKYSISTKPDIEFTLSGYKRTGFLEDEP